MNLVLAVAVKNSKTAVEEGKGVNVVCESLHPATLLIKKAVNKVWESFLPATPLIIKGFC